MKKITFLFLLLATIFNINAQNDCQNALSIVPGTYTVAIVNGQELELDCTQNSVGQNAEWYLYTAPNEDVLVTVSTDLSQNTGGDTRLSVLANDCNNLVCFAGDDDSGNGFLSYLQFSATANQSYYIVFDNQWSSAGFDFVLEENDEIDPPLPGDYDVTFVTQSISTPGSDLAFVDMNHDFLDDVVSVSNSNITINYQKEEGGFDHVSVNTPQANNNPSWSMACGDLDGNGYMDLLYGGGQGATFMYGNKTETSNPNNNYADNYTELSPSIYIFSQRTNFVDINNDGLLDAFVCHDVAPNVYFINDGNGGLISHQVGDGNSVDLGLPGSNYATIFFDYDNDHDIDMYISKCTSSPNRLIRNNGDGTYTDVSTTSGDAYSLLRTWASATGDFNNDGYMDILVGASSGANGLMVNNGDGTFTDVTTGSGFDTFNNTSHEYISADFNNDGWIDILSSGQVMMNNGNMTFTVATSFPGEGAIGDANNDGFLDVFSGGTLKINQNTEGNWIKINPIGVESNLNGIGARVEIITAMGTQIRDIKSGVGFRYMSTLTAHFGFGEDAIIESVTVYWPSGNIDVINTPEINSTLNITEGQSPLSINENLLNNVSIYPNPVTKKLTISTSLELENSIVAIFDIQGKKVYNSPFETNNLDVSNLEAGVYFLRIIQDEKQINLKFIKK